MLEFGIINHFIKKRFLASWTKNLVPILWKRIIFFQNFLISKQTHFPETSHFVRLKPGKNLHGQKNRRHRHDDDDVLVCTPAGWRAGPTECPRAEKRDSWLCIRLCRASQCEQEVTTLFARGVPSGQCFTETRREGTRERENKQAKWKKSLGPAAAAANSEGTTTTNSALSTSSSSSSWPKRN